MTPPTAAPGAPAPRFVPGAVFAERYRIVGLLGRGGMGEVYRADDLRLGQAVALKFLPPTLSGDPERRERFYNEVRTARQVAHPAVCRVYDVGEAEGQPFLTMEYVDGEDLASLLRRIGRLPPDKAVDIARQLCSGLFAAHERGVLHRDLKPDNVMLDGRGKVRITDFGLAGLMDTFAAEDLRSGTPAYMSPEQLAGREVTTASDIYSLGLVLYEIFTGRKAFDGRTLAEVMRKQAETTPASPSDIVHDIDPVAEAALLRCLEKDPRLRPPSALAVAAALPGGDPLAAALAAGETPSPEMVAAAQRAEGLQPWIPWAALAVVVAALAAAPFLLRRAQLTGYLPLDKPPEALEDRARDIVRELGHDAPATDAARGWTQDAEYVQSITSADTSPDRWETLRTGRPAALRFWFRQSPRPLVSASVSGRVSPTNPPVFISGMAGVDLDLQGRLLAFYAVPPQVEEPAGPAPSPSWTPLFAQARLDPARFTPATPRWTPPVHNDTRAAWTGADPVRADVPIRVEAAAYRGRPVYFQVIGAWTRPERMLPFQRTPAQTMANHVGVAVILCILVTTLVLARRNVRLGRGDRQGARRLATFALAGTLLSWTLSAHHVADLFGELSLFVRSVGVSLTIGVILWLLYLAVEPYLRRGWPGTLISWTRLLGGRVQDPLVGRDVLLGLALGAMLTVSIPFVRHVFPRLLGIAPPVSDALRLTALLGPRYAAAEVIDELVGGLIGGLITVLIMLLLRLLLRREWLAAPGFVLLHSIQPALLSGASVAVMLPAIALFVAVPFYVAVRIGVLATVVAVMVVECVVSVPVMVPAHWGATALWINLAVLAAALAFAFRAARGGRSALV